MRQYKEAAPSLAHWKRRRIKISPGAMHCTDPTCILTHFSTGGKDYENVTGTIRPL